MKHGMRELMRLSDVRRWHTVRMAPEQTLADHSCRVALIALQLHWHHTGEANNADVATLLTTALLHDAAEVHLGDPPPAGKTVMYVSDEIALLNTLPPPFKGLWARSTEARNTIKVADRIEAWLWIRENAVGHHSQGVAARCFAEMERVAADWMMTDAAISVIKEITGENCALCPF